MHNHTAAKFWIALFGLAVLELLVAVSWYGIYLFPVLHPQSILSNGVFSFTASSLQILFILLPIGGVIGCWKRHLSGPIFVASWPLVSTFFAVSAIPIATVLVPDPGELRFIVVCGLNLAVILATGLLALFVYRRRGAHA